MIELQGIQKSFGKFRAVQDVSLKIENGEFVALLGPSGCGKTTLLRIIAGLDFPEQGKILIHDVDVSSHSVRQREIGFVFQHYALFRHMTVFGNVAFGLEVKRKDKKLGRSQIEEKVSELLHMVQLDWATGRYPQQLSGGQRQRIALARALAVEPNVLLLDEPFGSLDAKVRKELRRWLRRLHDDMGLTSVFVTHDQEEAMEIADRIVVINQGKVEQVGTPEQIYTSPASAFVFHFLGNANTFEGRFSKGRFHVGNMQFPIANAENVADQECILGVRPHDVYIRGQEDPDWMAARVKNVFFLGPTTLIEMLTEGDLQVDAELNSTTYNLLRLQRNQTVFIQPRNAKLFTREGARL